MMIRLHLICIHEQKLKIHIFGLLITCCFSDNGIHLFIYYSNRIPWIFMLFLDTLDLKLNPGMIPYPGMIIVSIIESVNSK